MARLKAEFLQNFHDANGVPFRSWLIGHINTVNAIGIYVSGLYNFLMNNSVTSSIIKKFIGFARQRSIPKLNKQSLRSWIRKHPEKLLPDTTLNKGSVYLFIDEFTNYTDVNVGISAISLLSHLGYEIKVLSHPESGRAFLSKGMVKKAKKNADRNVKIFSEVISERQPLIGIEPSAILSFRDEYPDLVDDQLKTKAIVLSSQTFTIEEFLSRSFEAGEIKQGDFTERKEDINYHVHCHQKSLSSEEFTQKILSIPANYNVQGIPSGCCGMAGSFGFEKEHYKLSMDIGELVLFPSVRNLESATKIAASGTSCRHQILDGTGRKTLHPVEVLWNALKIND
jgi:Fe-S oxidoreductase